MRRGNKTIPLLLLGALLLLLSGCRREMEAKPIVIRLHGEESAVFSGVLEDGLGEGALEFPDWTYTGSFRAATEEEPAALLSGTGENFPWTLVFVGEEVSGRYSGPLENALPAGEGTFRGENGLVFTGEIFGQAPLRGEITGLPLTLSFQGSRYYGRYAGPVENGLPEGETVLELDNASGQHLRWEGGISAGLPAGEGVLRCDRLMTAVEGKDRAGTYEGAAVAAVPEGEGVFRSVDAQGIPWTYRGEWKDGLMDGQGELRYEAEDHLLRTGTFTAGSFTPSWQEALTVLGTGEPAFSLSQEQIEFLSRYPELWEGGSRTNFFDSPYRSEIDRKLTLLACFQDPEASQTPGWMEVYSLKVLSAYVGPAFSGGPDITRITAADKNYERVFYILVPGTVEGIASNLWINFVGVPIALSSYTTVLSTTHDCLVMVAGDMSMTK